MKLRPIVLALVAAPTIALVSACTTGPRVSVDADPQANFSAFRTYSWAYASAPEGVNPLLTQRVRAAIDKTLAARGYTQADPGDFAVGFTLGARNRVETTTLGGYGAYYRPWGGWGGVAQVDVRNVTDGTLTIDIYDATTKAAVWNGQATKEVRTDQIAQEKVDAAVEAVLAKFPPQS